MSADPFDTCLHQWTLDFEAMKEILPDIDDERSVFRRNITDLELLTGTLMPTLPWNHAFWNEDVAIYDDTASGEVPSEEQYRAPDSGYTQSEAYKSPSKTVEYLDEAGLSGGLLLGHEIQFLPSIPDPNYEGRIASAYNTLVAEQWLDESDRLKGGVVIPPNDLDTAVKEIEKYADDPRFVTVVLYPGGDPLGDDSFDPVYDAAVTADMPLTIHTSGNPVHRQTALGIPEDYVTYDVNLSHHHMSNMTSMVVQGVFDKFPDLDVVWAGEGMGWSLQVQWRTARYYRNYFPLVPEELEEDPQYYIENNCYFTTFPLGNSSDADLQTTIDLVGVGNILFASGYPRWNDDTTDALDGLDEDTREKVFQANAQEVYGI